MRKLVLLLAVALPLIALLAAAQETPRGDAWRCVSTKAGTILCCWWEFQVCSITAGTPTSVYEVAARSENYNSMAVNSDLWGSVAEDRYGEWEFGYLPAENKFAAEDEFYWVTSRFYHNYSLTGKWYAGVYIYAEIFWYRWFDITLIGTVGSVYTEIEYPKLNSYVVEHYGSWNKYLSPSVEVKKGAGPNGMVLSGYIGYSGEVSFSQPTVVEGRGSQVGWMEYKVIIGKVQGHFFMAGNLINSAQKPKPQPKPDSVSVWARDDATGRAILNASVSVCWYDWYWYSYYCANETTPTGRSGSRFELTAYNSSGLWLARTDVGWYSSWGWLSQDPLLPGRYLIPRANTYTSQPLSGAHLVRLYVVGSLARVYLQVEDPPGSGSYKTVAQGELPDWGGGWGYSGVLQLNNQRLRITYSDTNQWHPAEFSGEVEVAEPLTGSAQLAGWEVYKGSDLVIKTSSATVGEFGSGDGSSYTAIAVYSLQRKLTVKLVKPDGTPAYGAWVKVDGVEYSDCADGKCDGVITVNVGAGAHTVQVLDTYYNKTVAERGLWSATSTTYNQRYHWQRYTFWKWSDGDASNPRTVTVSNDTTLVAYVWDEKRLWILYEPRYGSDPWGVKAVSLPDRYSGYVGKMVPYGTSFWLRPGESFTLQAVEGGAARFLRWEIATECYPRNPYSVDPIISLAMGGYGLALRAVFRLGPSNQTMYLPGEGVPNPVFWSIYEQYAGYGCDGRKGTWLLNVTAVHAAAQTAFSSDSRMWIYALLVKPGTLETAWVPVNGSWKLRMDKDWDAVAHKLEDCSLDNPYADACRYTAYTASSISDFPQVVSGAPSKYRGWRLVALAAWKPLLPNESYNAGAVSAVWSGSATYALYNVTFKHVDSGWVYWQPVAVSALRIESATAKYKLGSYDSQLRRSPIYMWIEAVVDWAYVPPNSTLPSLPPNVTLWMAGFKPSRVWNVGVALENSAGVVVWAPRGSAYGATGKLYTLSIGDTELFYREPRGLNQGSRAFRLVARFVARAGQPGVRVDDGIPVKAELGFTLAPATAVIAGFKNNDPWKLVVDWDCFTSGSLPLSQARMNVRYLADFCYEWGPVDPYNGTLPPLGRKLLNSVYPTVLVSDVDPDYWVAFYPIPSGNQYPVAPNSVVPVPLPAKYPPRAKG